MWGVRLGWDPRAGKPNWQQAARRREHRLGLPRCQRPGQKGRGRQPGYLCASFFFLFYSEFQGCVHHAPATGKMQQLRVPSLSQWAELPWAVGRTWCWGSGWESLQNPVPKHRACSVLVLLWPNLDSITHRWGGLLSGPPPKSMSPSWKRVLTRKARSTFLWPIRAGEFCWVLSA